MQFRRLTFLLFACLASSWACADGHSTVTDELIVTYPAGFFARYQPNTALEMVNQVPGFQLDDGTDQRGFGAAIGNVLINDRYPSAKQDTPTQILQRIPASQVLRVELIRGQVREIDLLGRPVVLNLVLAEDTPAAIRWEAGLRKNFTLTPLAPNGGISLSDRIGSTTYNVGVDARRASFGDPGTRDIYDGAGTLVERRIEDHEGSGFNANAYLTASAEVGETLLQFNSTLGFEYRDETLDTLNQPQDPDSQPTNDSLIRERRNRKFELGVNAERDLSADLKAKAILLHYNLDQEPLSEQRLFDENGNQTLFRQADTEAQATEDIARVEFVWTRFQNHVLQLNVEGARNTLENALVQTVDDGSGPEEVPVPGANSRVEESRADILLQDTWTFGNSKIEVGLGAEKSTISQSGDAVQERSFTFVKPRAAYTYVSSADRQTRFSIGRSVSQLDFNDFVSATVFEDDDLALGNPDLRPESTWAAELSEEWRFGDLGALKLTAFHDWISDVEDLLPLTPEFEAPGNIGDGSRWGLEVESTLPLERFGLKGAKLDTKLRWQDSSVPDPVTGNDRVLTAAGGSSQDIVFRNENRYTVILDFRQDLEEAQIAWGWRFAERAERPLYKVNELEIYDERAQLNAFVETTRWWDIKMSLTLNNILDVIDTRERTLYSGERGLSPVDRTEIRTLTNGVRIILGFAGEF